MNTITKTLVGTVATLAMAVGAVTPAAARDRDNHISTGEVIAGAVVLGGIAAVASAASRDNNYRYGDRNYRDRDYRDRNWDGRGNGWYDYDRNRRYGRGQSPEGAVNQCVRAAEREAQRYGGGRADVTRIRDVDRSRNGYEVTGRIAVSSRYNDRSWNSNRGRNVDNGRFYCEVRNGRVVDIDIDGIDNRGRNRW